MMKRVKPWLPAIGIFCLALLVRVIYNNTVAHNYYPTHDSAFYQAIGFNLLKEHCFCLESYIPSVDRAPLWPFIIAGLTSVFGPSDYFARLFLSVIGSGTCVLIYLFARDLFGWRIGILAGVIAAIYPELYIYDGWLYAESLFTFLLFAVCYGLFRLQRTSQRKWHLWTLCGILLGLLSLTRPNGMLVIGLVIIWAIIMAWQKLLSWRVAARGALATTLLALVIIAPWTVRNYLVSHTFIPVATGDGTVLLGAYNDKVLTTVTYAGGQFGTWIRPLDSDPVVALRYPIHTCSAPCQVAREAAYQEAAIQWIRTHLSIMPHLLALHFVNMWHPDTHESDLPTDRFRQQQSTQLVLDMMRTFPIFVFILAGLGFVLTLRRWRELLFIYLMILMTIAECIIYYGIPRFRAPIEPMLILLAAGMVWWLTHKEEGTLRWIVHRINKKDQLVADTTSHPQGTLALASLP